MAKPSGTNLPKAFQSPRHSLKDGNGGEEKDNALARSGNSGQAPAREARHEACTPFTDTLQGTPRRRRPADRKEIRIKAAIARGIHLFPSRTEKLSPAAPMVLRKWESRSPPHKKPGQDASRCPGFPFSPIGPIGLIGPVG